MTQDSERGPMTGEELRERLKEWAEEMCLEAVVQGFEAGQEHAHRETVERGQGARLLSGRQIRENEAPFVPIIGSEMDGFPVDVLTLLDAAGADDD